MNPEQLATNATAHAASCKVITVLLDGSVNLTPGRSHTESWHVPPSSAGKVRVQALKTIRRLSNPTWFTQFYVIHSGLDRGFLFAKQVNMSSGGFQRA